MRKSDSRLWRNPSAAGPRTKRGDEGWRVSRPALWSASRPRKAVPGAMPSVRAISVTPIGRPDSPTVARIFSARLAELLMRRPGRAARGTGARELLEGAEDRADARQQRFDLGKIEALARAADGDDRVRALLPVEERKDRVGRAREMRVAPQHIGHGADVADVAPDAGLAPAGRIWKRERAAERRGGVEIVVHVAVGQMREQHARHLGAMKRHGMTAPAAQHARTLRLDVVNRHTIAADDDREIDTLGRQRVKLLEIGPRERHDVELARLRGCEGKPAIAELIELARGITRKQVLAHQRRERAVHHVLVEVKLPREIGHAARAAVAQKRAEHFEHAAGGLIAVFVARALDCVHRVDSKTTASLRSKSKIRFTYYNKGWETA